MPTISPSPCWSPSQPCKKHPTIRVQPHPKSLGDQLPVMGTTEKQEANHGVDAGLSFKILKPAGYNGPDDNPTIGRRIQPTMGITNHGSTQMFLYRALVSRPHRWVDRRAQHWVHHLIIGPIARGITASQIGVQAAPRAEPTLGQSRHVRTVGVWASHPAPPLGTGGFV